jgi:hypothetical protein
LLPTYASSARRRRVEGPAKRIPFDQQARADLAEIDTAGETVGWRLQSAFPEYDTTNLIVGGSFGFDWCTTYVLDPGWTLLPTDSGLRATPINKDWYRLDCSAS